MDLGSLFLILSLLILVGLFISRPFFERRLAITGDVELQKQEEHELSYLLAERDRILNALQELDFDHALGKIPDEDFPSQRAVLVQRGADILRRLDLALSAANPASHPGSDDVEARIEAAIAARRADAGSSQAYRPEPALAGPGLRVAHADDELETLLAQRRRARVEKAGGFCPQCGGPVQKSDRFCPKCGAKLA